MWPLSIIAILVTLGLGYIWLTRGFFSSLIHLICTIIAGAIAFAVWEPISYWLLEASPTGGVMSFLAGVAWGVGIIVPFSVSLILLRLIVDKLLPGNVVLQPKLDYIGGGVCGVFSGMITAGILVIGLSFFRLDSDVLGSPIAYGGTSEGSSIVRGGGLWVPVDRWTAGLYGGLSERAFRTGEPLAKWHPDLAEEGAGIRLSAFEGRGRNTTKTGDFALQGRFTVGEAGGAKFSEMLKDRWDPMKSQRVVDPDKHEFPPDTHIEGFLVLFKPASKERDGKTAIGAGQLHLVLENGNEERMTVYPFAVSSQAEADKPMFARWRYDSDNVFIASVGAGAETQMAFEFPCPPGYKPVALYVKGVRSDVDAGAPPKWKFRSGAERDAVISSNFGQIVSTGKGGATTTVAAGNIDTSEAIVIKRLPPPGGNAQSGLQPPEGMRITEMLPFIIQKGVHGNLELDEENNKNIILRGDATLTLDVLQNKGLEKSIQVQRLLTTPDTLIVQLDVGQGAKTSILGKSSDSSENPPPALFDTNGTRYEPVGFIYQDETKVIVSFKPGEPITSMSLLPNLSRSRPAQKLSLIFRCSRGVSLKHFGLGTKALVTFDPPLLMDQSQGRGG